MVHTSRARLGKAGGESEVQVQSAVSSALVEVVRGISVRPRFVVAKGGITSSDIATAGLGVRRAWVLGQLEPGVPVWRLGAEARWPGLVYIVFPGNVGGPQSLASGVKRLCSLDEGSGEGV